MAHVHVKTDEQRRHEAYVLKTFGKGGEAVTAADRDAAAVIAARSREALNTLKKQEGKRNG